MTVASTSTEPKATTSGIVERADSQQRVIPESRRADGSIRKERKVRPGFTPVEDVVRYRPTRAKEAEEARKRAGVPGSAAPASVASSSSSPSASRAPVPSASSSVGRTDPDRMAWRSSAARTPTASHPSEPHARSRVNDEPRPAKQPKEARGSLTASTNKSDAPTASAQPWRNSRLRKLQPPTAKRGDEAAVPEAWDQEEARQDKHSKVAESAQASAKTSTSADDLAAQLDNLRIKSNDASKAA